MRERIRSVVALLAAFVVSVSCRALSDLQLLTDSTVSSTAEPTVQSDEAASLTAINTWETSSGVSVAVARPPPPRAPPDAALTIPGLQLGSNASTAAATLAAPPARTPAPPARAPVRGVPSPGLLAEIASFPSQSDAAAAASTNSSTAEDTGSSTSVDDEGITLAVLERAPAPADRSRCNRSSNSSTPCVQNASRDSVEAPLVSNSSNSSRNSSNVTSGASLNSSNTTSGSIPAGKPQRGASEVDDGALHAAHLVVPDRCIIAGSALFSNCAAELSEAQAHFNISVSFLEPQNYTQLLVDRGITRAQVLQYLRSALARPSDSCCAAQCCYNQLLLCDCEPSVVEVAVRFSGVDEDFYALMVAQLARSCGIKHFYGDTCPLSISYPASTAAACTESTAWPPVRDTSPAPLVGPARSASPTPGAAAATAGPVPTAAADEQEDGEIVCMASPSADVADVAAAAAAPAG